MNYGALISEAFWLTWRNRFLWFFGLFAGWTAFSPNVNINTPMASAPRERGAGDAPPAWLFNLARWIVDNLGLIIAISVLGFLVLIALSALSQGALVESPPRSTGVRRVASRRA